MFNKNRPDAAGAVHASEEPGILELGSVSAAFVLAVGGCYVLLSTLTSHTLGGTRSSRLQWEERQRATAELREMAGAPKVPETPEPMQPPQTAIGDTGDTGDADR